MHQSQGPSSAEGVQWEPLVRAAPRTSPRVLPATMGSIDRIPLFTWFLGVELRFDRIRSAAGTCESCDSGFYSDVLEARGCNRCNAGTYSQQNSSSCSLCLDVCPAPPIYHYFYFFLIIYLFCKMQRTYSLEGASTCTPCPAGTHSNGPGASSCTPCKDGYISQTASTSCTVITPSNLTSPLTPPRPFILNLMIFFRSVRQEHTRVQRARVCCVVRERTRR